jgi:hypothetical protein
LSACRHDRQPKEKRPRGRKLAKERRPKSNAAQDTSPPPKLSAGCCCIASISRWCPCAASECNLFCWPSYDPPPVSNALLLLAV